MRHFLHAIPLALVLFSSCAGWRVPPAIQIAADASVRARPALIAVEQAQGDAAIARGEDPFVTVAPKWEPFWAAWKVWVATQGAWADAYNSGAPGLTQAEAAARAAFCALGPALPKDVPPAVLEVDVVACADLSTLGEAGAQDGGR